jgi:hypothetical protein
VRATRATDRETAAPAPSPWFSGVLVSQVLVSEPKGSEPRVDGEQSFFVSGANLLVRETSTDGALRYELTYDPERNVLYQLAPEFKVIEPSETDVDFSFTGHIRTILDYNCQELERRSPTETARVFVATRLRIDPNAFRNLKYRGWVKQLEFTGGALELYGELERADHVLILRAVRVERRALDASTWKLDEARALARRAP